jgi:tRNA pseudouridine55 synthase
VCVVDKPAGMTSHDVVAACRRTLGERRVGHAGTLDPDATGVLVVGVGSATRLLRFLSAAPKSYTAEVVLGVETTTLDAGGEVTARHDMRDVTVDDVRAVVADHLTGPVEQVPPMMSAVHHDGRRLHELARKGIEVERAPRSVVVSEFEIVPTPDPLVYEIAVTCSAGTYVRVLAADLGRLLGGGAHLRFLRRTASGGFTETDARPLDTLELLPVRAAVRDLEQVVVDDDTARRVGHGAVLPRPAGEGPWALLSVEGEVLAVYERRGTDAAKPAVVLVQGAGAGPGR